MDLDGKNFKFNMISFLGSKHTLKLISVQIDDYADSPKQDRKLG